jgi:hypothetical protein
VSSICLCYVEDVSKARLDYVVRKLSSKSSARIVVWLLSESGQSEGASAPRHEEDDRSHSLTATIATLKNPKDSPKEPAGTNATSRGSGFNWTLQEETRHAPRRHSFATTD